MIRHTSPWVRLVGLALFFQVAIGAGFAQAPATSQVQTAGSIDVQADRIEYDADRRLLIGIGNVVVTQNQASLEADYIEVETETQDAYARGNVIYRDPGRVWEGDELRYNLETGQGDFGEFDLFSDPFYITAEDSERVSTNRLVLENAGLSTCEGDNPDFVIRARDAVLLDGHKLRAKNVLLVVAGIPVFYLPMLNKDLEKDSNLDLVPGYSDSMGAFLLSAYNYPVTDELRAATRLDYRTKRGVGVGQDFTWEKPGDYFGGFRAYYADDQEPIDDNDQTEEELGILDNDRYRLRLSHNQTFTPRDYLIVEMNYLSDPDILEDFFDEEFRNNAQPENRVTFTHRDDFFTAGLELTRVLNDEFYGGLNRLPELSLDFYRQPVGGGFYYEGQNRFSVLERAFPSELSEDDDYDAIRFDSRHLVLYPTRTFGFLNLIPRAGYRMTYYSDTRDQQTVTNVVTVTDTNGVSSLSTNIETATLELGSDIRNVYELGLESSFKAFKVLHDRPIPFGKGLRHVAEPFANWTFRPEPNLTRDDLPQFDSVDRIAEQNTVRLGLRNKLQTKVGGRPHDLIDLVVYSDYDLDADADEDDFSPVRFDGEVRPYQWIGLDFDGSHDFNDSETDSFNTRLRLYGEDDSNIGVEYRFARDRRELLTVGTELFPRKQWSFGGYWRYDFEGGELQEQRYTVLHKTDCLGLGLGVRELDDEITLWAQIWLLAFPDSAIGLGK